MGDLLWVWCCLTLFNSLDAGIESFLLNFVDAKLGMLSNTMENRILVFGWITTST